MSKSRKEDGPKPSGPGPRPRARKRQSKSAPAPDQAGAGAGFPASAIAVRGARVHNLRNIDVDLPADKLVVLTGVSGSGKSSLAFDTVHAEGQRRYIESISPLSRGASRAAGPPEVDAIEGLPPTVAIDQKSAAAGPRGTLGTITEIYDYIRLLFARRGTPHCPRCGRAVSSESPARMVEGLLALPEGKKVQLLAPLARGRAGGCAEVFEAVRRAGLVRVRVDGTLIELSDAPPALAPEKKHNIEAVVDRLVVRAGVRPRLAESLDLALKLGEGQALALIEAPGGRGGGWDERWLSARPNCAACGQALPQFEPRHFSFNGPGGACPRCQGVGSRPAFAPELAAPDRARSFDEGAIVPWALVPPAERNDEEIVDLFKRWHVDPKAPLGSWPEAAWRAFWHGEENGTFPGLAQRLERVLGSTRDRSLAVALEAWRGEAVCGECGGARLNAEARAVRFAGRTVPELIAMPSGALLEFFRAERPAYGEDPVAGPVIEAMVERLGQMVELGLGYLALGRSAETLSGGELQRARLAARLGPGLVGVCYVLDEPTAGLHPRDTARLIDCLRRLQALGNSLIVVEHDEDVVRAADWIVDLGPGAGPDGGAVVAQGDLETIVSCSESFTGAWLARRPETIGTPPRGEAGAQGWLHVRGASAHNLKTIDVSVPLGRLTCVTGVSGSGKSTLARDVLARPLRRALDERRRGAGAEAEAGAFARALERSGIAFSEGAAPLRALVEVDQAPIGRTPRATPATITGVFDALRRVYAATREARLRGYGARRFSFNAPGGRCEECLGLGVRRISTRSRILPEAPAACPACGGLRYNRATLEVRFKGRSIGEALRLRVDEARELFGAVPKVVRGLDALREAGLGYLSLGQSSATLSGGEAQRVKLAAELARFEGGALDVGPGLAGHSLYVLDEPTTGLHPRDVERLLQTFGRLLDQGHTIVVIEHHLDLIARADWVIDLGPEGGELGGHVVAMGPPAAVAAREASHTGRALAGRAISVGSQEFFDGP